MFPLNAWYVAATPEELGDKPLGRTICNENICFFRGVGDQVVALADYCPHRGVPLSLGRVKNGNLICGYHGLEMDCEGNTIAMKGQNVNKFPTTRTYTVVERYGFIWIWMGEDPSAANPNGIPKPPWADHDNWVLDGGVFNFKCDYRLLVDNLMDLTHETYVHANSIGQAEIDEAEPETTIEGDTVITARHMRNITAPAFWQGALKSQGLDPKAKVDRWQVCRFVPPSNVLIDVGVAIAGCGGIDAPSDKKASGIVVDYITPETETSCWYFWGLARFYQTQDKKLTEAIREGQRTIFEEDREILERQQKNLSDKPELKLLTLNIDAGGAHARRIIKRLCKQENKNRKS